MSDLKILIGHIEPERQIWVHIPKYPASVVKGLQILNELLMFVFEGVTMTYLEGVDHHIYHLWYSSQTKNFENKVALIPTFKL